MGYYIVEYWRGLEELRPMIYFGSQYDALDPEAFYVGSNSDIESPLDIVDPKYLDPNDKKLVKTYNFPGSKPRMRELYVGEHHGILCEII